MMHSIIESIDDTGIVVLMHNYDGKISLNQLQLFLFY